MDPITDAAQAQAGTPTPTTPPPTQGAPDAPQAKPTQPPQPVNPEDVQGLVTRESRKAVEKLLKDAGIMPGENPEMQLREYKKWLDTQKTDLEKAQGDVQTVTGERDEARAELSTLKNTFVAIQKGVPASKAPQYIKMTELHTAQGKSFEDALDAVIKDFPVTPPTPAIQGPRYTGTSGQVQTEGDGAARTYKPPRVL